MKPKNLYWDLYTKWVLLGEIISAVSSRRVKQEMAKQGVGPVNMAGVMLRIVLIAMFCFSP